MVNRLFLLFAKRAQTYQGGDSFLELVKSQDFAIPNFPSERGEHMVPKHLDLGLSKHTAFQNSMVPINFVSGVGAYQIMFHN